MKFADALQSQLQLIEGVESGVDGITVSNSVNKRVGGDSLVRFGTPDMDAIKDESKSRSYIFDVGKVASPMKQGSSRGGSRSGTPSPVKLRSANKKFHQTSLQASSQPTPG